MKDFSADDLHSEFEAQRSLKSRSISILARIVTALALILLPLVFFYPAVKGAIILAPGDGWSQNLPIRILIGELIRNGQLPLWNPYIFCGMPLLGAIQPGALYPPNWLFAVFSPKTAMNLVVITTYHVALIGAYLYARRIGCNRLGSMIAGITFAFGGFMTAHLGHTNLIATGAWLPWILLALEELYLNLRWRWVALGALFIALLFFAGGPQVTCYALMVAGAYGLFSLKFREERERRGRFLFGAAAMTVCGALIAAIQLLPTRELQQQGERAALTYENFASYSLPPQHLFEMIFPYFFGGGGLSPYKIPYWGKWGTTETASYVGMLAMIFGLVALIGQFKQKKHNRLIWFWGGFAVVAMFLALGVYMPFSIHRLLYHVPVYNLFRASSRNVFEFDFAFGVLAGLGVTWVSRNKGEFVWRAIWAAAGVMALIVGVTAIVYRFFADYLVMELPVPEGARLFSNPHLVIPVVFFVLSVLAVVLYALCRERSAILKNAVGAAMVMLFFADVASFGFFYEWNGVEPGRVERLADTPTVKYIKERERDLNSFRVISYSLQPHGRNSDLLDYPNISIPRGLQSANGYDPIYLSRYKTMAGDMSFIGEVREPGAFGRHDQSFNLLNLKYLLFERPDLMGGSGYIGLEGIRFLADPIYLRLAPGKQADIDVKATATELAIISAMGTSNHVPNGAPVVTIALYTKDGRVIERQLLAGQHTSEWSYDYQYQRDPPKHARAPVVENIPAEEFEGHLYLARFPFEKSEIERVAFRYELQDANVMVWRASFHDAETGQSTALSAVGLPADRWRKLTQFGDIEVYENTKALPRAWFARRAAIESSVDTLQIIKTGKMKDGSPFDPAETVLFEKEYVGDRDFSLQIGDPANAEAKVTRYEPQRIELQTRNSQPGFLVLSEIYYSGWDAWIDGHRTPVERVNYSLRGLAVPAGDHRIEFVFRARSFQTGAVCSLLGVLLLLVGASNRTRRVLTKAESRWEAPATRLLISTESKIREWIVDGKLITRALDIVEPKLSALSKSRLVIVAAAAGLLIYGYFLVRASYGIGAVGATVSGLVNPIVGLFSIFLIYRAGLELELPRGFSMAGAIMLAGSPTFIFMSTQPMSDSVAMFWSLAAILAALLSRKRDGWASLAGLAFGMAFLAQPSGALLLIPILFSLRLKFKNILYFILGVLPPAVIFFIYNGAAYNHPLMAWRWAPNHQDPVTITGFIERFNFYRYWIKVTMSPLPLIGWLVVAVDRKVEWRNRAILVSWFGAFFLFYSFYDIERAWWNTRLLLPAYPAMILGSLLVARDLSGLLGKRISEVNKTRLSWVVLTILLAVTLSHQRRNIKRFDAFNVGRREIAHYTSCRWADQTIPAKLRPFEVEDAQNRMGGKAGKSILQR